MQKLVDRFKYLRSAEAAVAVLLPIVFPAYWIRSAAPVSWPFAIAVLALVSYLLVQGAIYWHLKHQALVGSVRLPVSFGPLFSFFRKSNLVLFCVFSIAAIAYVLVAGWSIDLAWPLALFAFSVLEYVNYYHYQLMYDTADSVRYVKRNHRLRRAALGTDLKRIVSA